MKRFLIGWMVCVLFGCGLAAAAPKTADELLDAMGKAQDPKGVVSSLRSFRLCSTSRIEQQNLVVRSESLFLLPDKFRVMVSIPGMPKSVTMYDGKDCFREDGIMGVTPVRGLEKEVTVYLAKLSNPRADFRKIFQSLTLEKEPVDLDGRKCYKLVAFVPEKLKLPPFEFFIDSETFLLRRMKFHVIHIASPIPTTTDILEYADFDGVKSVCRSRDSYAGITVDTKVDKLEFNVPIAESAFRPKD